MAITLGVLALIVFIPFVCLRYTTRYKEKLVDKTSSPDKQYILSMYSVGEPYWPFGGAPGRLILEMANSKVARAEFEIANDGARFDEDSWDVTWCSDRVEVVLSGNEQYDELVTMYFDGGVERKSGGPGGKDGGSQRSGGPQPLKQRERIQKQQVAKYQGITLKKCLMTSA